MPRFAFKAIDHGGTTVTGEIDAVNRMQALDLLSSNGQTPISLDEPGDRSGFRLLSPTPFRSKSSEFLTLVRELSSLLGAGLTVERALGVLRTLASDRHRALRISQVLETVRAGAPLSRALDIVVPRSASQYTHLIAAGEASGQLPLVMARMATLLTRAKTLREKLVSALVYPLLLVVTMLGVIWIVFTSVLPRLTPIFSQARAALPASTEILLVVSRFVHSYGWLLLLAVALCSFGAIRAYRGPVLRAKLHRHMLRTRLLLDIPRNYEAAGFCRNLETLLSGGQTLDRALHAARLSAGNLWFQTCLFSVSEAVEEGRSLASALANAEIFPPLVVELAAVGEETGKLAEMMGDAAISLESDLETRLDRLMALILPIATLVMGALVAGIMFGVVAGLLAVNDLAM